MATFDMNKRGGFTVDRDSLHASDGHKRQVEALKQLQERPMNADVEKAVERFDRYREGADCGEPFYADHEGWDTIRQALRDQEAEIASLNERQLVLRGSHDFAIKRAEKAEALLREAIEWNWLDDDSPRNSPINHDSPSVLDSLYLRITAHLGAEQ